MNKSISILSVICIIFLVGCKRYASNDSITCINGINTNTEKYVSSIFPNFEIIRLETVDESLIGQNINKIRKKDNKYFISCDKKELMVFDRQGKFLSKIEKIGAGPSEYTTLRDFDVLPNGNIIILDVKKLLFYSITGEFIKAIPLDITCYNIKVIDNDNFLICATAQNYIIYLINSDGQILSKQLERKNRRVLGKYHAFYTFGNDHIIYQQHLSNDFLFLNTKTNEFAKINLLCNEDRILDIKKINNNFDYIEKNPNVKRISAISTYTDYMFFVVGSQNSGFKGYLMNTTDKSIHYMLTENTVDDISFTRNLSLLNSIECSDSEECFITYLWPYQIIEGLNENIKFNEHPNYQRIQSLLKDIKNIENENPVLIELRR